MASNSFGHIFKITTWGESHGKAIGVVIDGCPAGLEIDEAEIQRELERRAPGKAHVSPRKEADQAQILSGVFEGKTTGAPISILIPNQDTDSSKYEPVKHLLKPGHANYTYLKKYGIFDHRGGGRSSGRETAARVAGGAIAKKFLASKGMKIIAFMKQMGSITASIDPADEEKLRKDTLASAIFCPDPLAESAMIAFLEKLKTEGNSTGGIVEFIAYDVPVGLGDPVYEKLEARLAFAMMGLPATKGFEIGSGFESVAMTGDAHNDIYTKDGEKVRTKTNFSGGILGGISNGMPIIGRVAFKPASSIKKSQETLNLSGEEAEFTLPEGSRHDPCVAIRAVPVVETMVALVLADAFLMNSHAMMGSAYYP